ncbi:MAG: cytochrome c [Vicinamibacterales bacterium]
MLLFVWFSGAMIALMLIGAALRRRRPRVLWRRALFYASMTFFAVLSVISWRASSASASELDPARVEVGKQLFDQHGCSSCHSVGKGLVFGPDLMGVGEKYPRTVLMTWMMDSDEIYRQFGRRPLASGSPDMPSLGVPEADARNIAEYLMSLHEEAPR